jgi:FAD/FMN-containing dehydrogenase
MTALSMTTITGSSITLETSDIDAFKANCRGHLIGCGDPGYEEARTIWNAHIDKRPAMIVRCVGVADVVQSVNFARTYQLLVAVRGGGHNFAGTSLCEAGLVIDLSAMTSVRVDPKQQTARAEGGAKWGHVDRETQVFGLATTGGTDSDTGIGGLTLGGGIGWLGGKYGLSCDNLMAADVVMADGQVCTASATENPDLWWALRGGCGNFGIVTSLEYQLYPVGSLIAGIRAYPFERASEVLRFYREFAHGAPDELNTACAIRTLPNGIRAVGIGVCYHGAAAAARSILSAMDVLGEPLLNTIQPRSYHEVQHLLDGVTPGGNQYYGKSHFMAEIGDAAIETLIAHFTQVPSPLSVLVFQQLGNAANRVASEATAFGHRNARYNLNLIGQWTERREAERHIEWVRTLWEALAPYGTGGIYVNHVGSEAEEGTAGIRAAYGANYERLVELKQKYDPSNLFRSNQNIRPALAEATAR